MQKLAYYNENDPKAAAWLRELIKAGLIAPGDVDDRSIGDVAPADLLGYTQCHFFAGIGGWSYALRLAGWSDSRVVWTGSCPCQPFSSAGKGKGFADERHLWPAWFHLIRECAPAIIFGEQVANALAWFDLVSGDLENETYAVGGAIIGAHSVGAPHIRQRLYFVAESRGAERPRSHGLPESRRFDEPADYGELGDPRIFRGWRNGGTVLSPEGRTEWEVWGEPDEPELAGIDGELEHAKGYQRIERRPEPSERRAIGGCWESAEWIPCSDGKARPVEPVAQQMANGLSLALGIVRSLRDDEKETLINAAHSTGFAAEVMRPLWSGVRASAVWHSLGGRIGFPEATVLLAVMCEHSRELGRIFYREATGGQQIDETGVRRLWETWEAACSPHGRELSEQCAVELKNLVSQLSQETALLVMFNGFPLTHGAPNRVGLLRGYGNAIVPQAAATFIRAYETSGDHE